MEFAFGLFGVLLLVKFVLAVAAVIHVFKTERPIEQKLLWTLVIFVPLIGPALYFVIGRKPAISAPSALDNASPKLLHPLD